MRRLTGALAVLVGLGISAPALAQSQTSDGSIGWCIDHDTGLTTAGCVAATGAVRGNEHADGFFEAQYERPLAVNVLVFGGGARIGGDINSRLRIFGQVGADALWLHTVGSVWGFVIHPGVGADVTLNRKRTIAFRPAFDVAIRHAAGVTGHTEVFSLNLVFRSFAK